MERFRLRDVDPDHPAMQVTMPLVSDHDGELRCIGTAFAVAPGLAITAAHVVDAWLNYQNRREGQKNAGAKFSAAAIQWFRGSIYQWDIDAIYGSRSADVSFLRFQRPGWWGDGPGQVKPRCARLSFNPPAVGDEVRVFGFPRSEVIDGVLYVSASECLARVTRVDLKTEIASRPSSHIDIEGQIDEGMSGGPCFDREWNVVGVNSKGWDFLEGPPLAHVALMWPAMKIPVDLFKSGAFPAIDLFKDGPARALGYRRVHVTSKGEARLAKVDPDSLVPLMVLGSETHLERELNFAGSNAQGALAQARIFLDNISSGVEPLDWNGLHRCLRHYFWELDSTLQLALGLAARRANLPVEHPLTWDDLVREWRNHGADAETLDELAALDFSWSGVDLFEVRTYAELCRLGGLHLTAWESSTHGLVAVVLEQCRKGGQQVPLPDDLDRFLDASKRFVQRLLRLSNRKRVSRPPPSEE